MTTKKAVKKKAPASKKRAKPGSPGILQPHAHNLRQIVHSALASAGIHHLSLQSIRFASVPECPKGQHAEQTCSKDPDGNETCTWNCVPN